MGRFERPQRALDRRVVITGMGALSPLGLTVQESWKNAIEGVSGIDKITLFDPTPMDAHIAGEVKNFTPENFIEKKEVRRMDRFIQFAMAAGKMALADSGFIITEKNAERTGVFVGAGIGGLPYIENQHSILLEKGANRVSPFFIPSVIANLAGGYLSIAFGTKGPNFCITSACATGAHSIGEAVQYIRRGVCDMMVAGGTEAVVCPMAIAGFASMKALSTRNNDPKGASRPFDKDRDGFVLSEGAAIMILEDLEHAEKRGARIYAEVTGYGLSSDAYHITSPTPEHDGAQRAMKSALQNANLNTTDINYINAHGTSTPVGDELEVTAVKKVFGDHSKEITVSSTKSMTGHLLGAAGALESVFCVLAIRDQVVPPTINLENPSTGCDLDFVPFSARDQKVTHTLNNSFGFGGTNACLIFSKLD